ncbi:MAG: hypothetical protein WC346_22515 [Methanogenium sp.]|jgi:hypothetical protein
MADTKELLEMKKKIENGEKKEIELKTRKETLLENLSSKYGCGSVKEAKALLNKNEDAIKKEQKELDSIYQELEELLG